MAGTPKTRGNEEITGFSIFTKDLGLTALRLRHRPGTRTLNQRYYRSTPWILSRSPYFHHRNQMETPKEDRYVSISYELADPPAVNGELPKFLTIKRTVAVEPGKTSKLSISTPYENPFPSSPAILCPDAKAYPIGIIRSIIKGVVVISVTALVKCRATIYVRIEDAPNDEVW